MMGSLYSGVTGLKSHSTGMSVISNNIANINTVAYKQSSILYEDLISQYMPTTGAASSTGYSQVGAGAGVSSIRTIYQQGSFEAGNSVTDMAISGTGFFAVNKNGSTEHTRSGNFTFTSEGALIAPGNWSLMGYSIVNGTESGSLTPVVIDTSDSGFGSMQGKATTSITSCSQLGGLTDVSSDAANPFFSMASNWNGAASPPLGDSQYSYSEAFSFYDTSGTLQQGTIYYDLAGKEGGQTAVEYVVAMAPSLDGSDLAETSAAGLLMAGTLTFSSSGELQRVTAFTPPSSGDPSDLASWKPAATENGSPVFSATVAGGEAQSIGLDMGLSLSGSASNGTDSAADLAANPQSVYAIDTNATRRDTASTAYGTTTGTIASSSDGYGTGYLQELSVASDGTISGTYSNGQSQDLYRVPLYRFTSEEGLETSGGNRYVATADSGSAEEGVAGTENFGTIAESTLEQSNVDLSTEFSNLIITQRGFQMNSKIVTTCDAMLQKALEIKR